jgi:hypothetical protein
MSRISDVEGMPLGGGGGGGGGVGGGDAAEVYVQDAAKQAAAEKLGRPLGAVINAPAPSNEKRLPKGPPPGGLLARDPRNR